MSAVAAPHVKKVAKKTKAAASHPPFAKMILEAVKDLKEKKGSSRQAILKHIIAHHMLEEKFAGVKVRRGLVAAVKAGLLSQTKGNGASGSFKIFEKVKAAPKIKVVANRTKVIKKVAVKKPATEKAAAVGTKKPKTQKKKAIAKPKKTSLKTKKPAVKKTPKKIAKK